MVQSQSVLVGCKSVKGFRSYSRTVCKWDVNQSRVFDRTVAECASGM